MISLLVMTDGRRECIAEAIPSALDSLHGAITRRIINDDSGDEDYRHWLREQFGPLGFELLPAADGRQGFGGAIRHAWSYVRAMPEPFVFHLEDDFTFNRPVDLNAMGAVLVAEPHLVQLALRRQAWNATEVAAGGVVEAEPDTFVDVMDQDGHRWLEQRRFFTTNPSLYRRTLTRRGWPEGDGSEGAFTIRMLATSTHVRFGYWGARESEPWVHHIGAERAGRGY